MPRKLFSSIIVAVAAIAVAASAAAAPPVPTLPAKAKTTTTPPPSPTPTVMVDPLTRIYRGDDGGALYLRHVGEKVYGFGEHPGLKYAYVLTGTVSGDLTSRLLVAGVSVTPLEWWDAKWIRDRVNRPLKEAGLPEIAGVGAVPDEEPARAAAVRPARRRAR